MIHENELIMLLLSSGVAVFAIFNLQKFMKITNWKLLFASFFLFPFACIFTVVEEFMLGKLLNYLEHICYSGSALLLMIWCYKVFTGDKDKNA